MTQNYFDLHYYVVTFKVDTSQLHITFFYKNEWGALMCSECLANSKVKNMSKLMYLSTLIRFENSITVSVFVQYHFCSNFAMESSYTYLA